MVDTTGIIGVRVGREVAVGGGVEDATRCAACAKSGPGTPGYCRMPHMCGVWYAVWHAMNSCGVWSAVSSGTEDECPMGIVRHGGTVCWSGLWVGVLSGVWCGVVSVISGTLIFLIRGAMLMAYATALFS